MELSSLPPEFVSIKTSALATDNPIYYWRKHKHNKPEYWEKLARAAKKDGAPQHIIDGYHAVRYITDDGFYHYCREVCLFTEMDEFFHGPICRLVVGKINRDGYFHRQRLIEAFRASFKSSITSDAYPTWLIAREYLLTGKCNIQIGLQSEILGHAQDHMDECRQRIESALWQRYFGYHIPNTRTKGSRWGNLGLIVTSRDKILKSPTIWTIALGAERTGYHFDIIIHDDLQAERSARTREQLENTWKLYRLNESLLNKPGISWYAEEVGAATRWNYDDIYGKIERENVQMAEEDRVLIMKCPILLSDGNPAFPLKYPLKEIERIRIKQGPAIFASQYMLEPTADADRPFKPEWIRYYSWPEIVHKAERMYAVTGVDFCWQDAKSRGRTSDHSVVVTFLVDDVWNFYIVDIWRGQVLKRETIREVYRQVAKHQSISVGCDQFDERYVKDDFVGVAFEDKLEPIAPIWVKRSGTRDLTKKAHIMNTLQGLFSAHRIFLYRGEHWLEQEILDFSLMDTVSGTDDGLDAMACAIKCAVAPAFGKQKVRQEVDPWVRADQSLLTRRPVNLAGKPIRLASAQTRARSARRARSGVKS